MIGFLLRRFSWTWKSTLDSTQSRRSWKVPNGRRLLSKVLISYLTNTTATNYNTPFCKMLISYLTNTTATIRRSFWYPYGLFTHVVSRAVSVFQVIVFYVMHSILMSCFQNVSRESIAKFVLPCSMEQILNRWQLISLHEPLMLPPHALEKCFYNIVSVGSTSQLKFALAPAPKYPYRGTI